MFLLNNFFWGIRNSCLKKSQEFLFDYNKIVFCILERLVAHLRNFWVNFKDCFIKYFNIMLIINYLLILLYDELSGNINYNIVCVSCLILN